MHTIPTSVLAFALAALLVPAATPKFAPKEGSEVTKKFVSAVSLESTSVKASMDGEDLPEGAMGSMQMSMTSKTTVEVSDRYVKVGDGRPDVLERTYVELADEDSQTQKNPGMTEPHEEESSKESALEGKTVRFEWDGEKDAYATAFVGEKADEALLEGLHEDLDLRALLPGRDAKVGDTWEVDGKEFGIEPGGNLHFEKEDGEKQDDDDFGQQIAANMKGKVVCKFAEVREEGGAELAVIHVTAELESSAEKEGTGQSAQVHATFELEGDLVWSLGAGRFQSLEIVGPVELEMKIEQPMEMGGESHTLRIVIALEGELKLTGEAGG